MKPTIWVRSAEVANCLDTNQKDAKQNMSITPQTKFGFSVISFLFASSRPTQITSITQPTPHWAPQSLAVF